MTNLVSTQQSRLYFVALDVSVQQYRKGFKLPDAQALNFFEFAAFLARRNHLDLFIKGMANDCHNNWILFRDLTQVVPGFFNRQTVCIYADKIESLRSIRSSLTDCRIILFLGNGLKDHIPELKSIYCENRVTILNHPGEDAFSFPLFSDFQKIESSRSKKARRGERVSPITMDCQKNTVLFLVDNTWRRSARKLLSEFTLANHELHATVIDSQAAWKEVADTELPGCTVIDLASTSCSDLNELFSKSCAIVYGGTNSPGKTSLIQFAYRRGLPIIATPSMSIVAGIRADLFYHDLASKHDLARGAAIAKWLTDYEPTEDELSSQVAFPSPPRDLPPPLATRDSVFESARQLSQSMPGIRVLWIGRFDFVGGYGAVARGYLAAMEAAGIPHLCIDIDSKRPVGKSTGFFWEHDAAGRRYFIDGPAILVINDLPTRFQLFKSEGFQKRIGCTLFETDSFPIIWNEGFKAVDEVLVPTQFNKETFKFAGIPEDRLRILGYSVDTTYYSPVKRSSSPKVRLLYVVSNLNRKDPGLLLRAYLAAFKRTDPVVLTIKIRMTEARFWETVGPQVSHRFDYKAPDAPEIRFVSGTVSEDVMRSIYEDTDIYVTTERAKGWDYPVMEAMAMGIPSISIDWSGSEFLNNENAYLIPARENLALAHSTQVDNAEMYFGHRWADVDEAEVVKALQKAIADRNKILELGKNCRRDVMRYSPEVIGEEMRTMLEEHQDRDTQAGRAVLYY